MQINLKFWMKVFPLLFLLVTVFHSCMIETAKKKANQQVIIFSDCLKKTDGYLFKKFTSDQNIKVKIVHLSADSLLARVKREGLTTNADVLILGSLYETQKAFRLKLFQRWNSPKLEELIETRYRSKDNTWFGIGVDPYVFVAKNDSLSTIFDTGELLHAKNKYQWSTNLKSSSQLIPFLAPVLRKKQWKEAEEWYSNFYFNEYVGVKSLDENDIPIMRSNILLTNYSTYLHMKKRSKRSDLLIHLLFINQETIGASYNLHCAGIVRQAKNYNNAKLLMEYISMAETNEKMNKRWKTFPISLQKRVHPFYYQNTPFVLFKVGSSRMMRSYPKLESIIKQKRADQLIQKSVQVQDTTVKQTL